MNSLPDTLALPDPAALPRSAKHVLHLLEGLAHGRLELQLPDGRLVACGHGRPAARMEVADWRLFDAVLARGDIGLADGWVEGDWHSPDPVALLTLFAANRAPLARAIHGRWWALAAARLRHLLNANTRRGARRNIMAHYDLGNAFYRQWLDPTMSYSSALYAGDPGRSLEAAQRAKYRRILRALGVRPGQRILEIGCGWGGFAELAAREAGVRVHGLTLSPAQLAYAQARMQAAGLDGQVTLALCDYRDFHSEPFDGIVSIEMFEAVGERWWPTYFATLRRLLRPGGLALVQSITIRDEFFAQYRRGTDFIQQQVFPGGMLPSPSAFARGAARGGLLLRDAHAFGADYARTLSEWRHAFERAWPAIAAQGFDERFRRLWLFYLAYCEAGFATGTTDVAQFTLERPA